jgi:N-acetyl-gamma-glutamyl-phosphate reductase common form
MIRVGVYGATGYMGGEALRVLLEHPRAEIAWATSRGDTPLSQIHRNLAGAEITVVKPEDITPVDVIFAALPSGLVLQLAPQWLAAGTKVIDLGADFRLKDVRAWEALYRKPHLSPALISEAVYGIPELHREAICGARLVANPGCFSSAAILGLAPLLKAGLARPDALVVDGLSGTAGAGAELDRAIHHPEIGNNIVPYNVVNHRHTWEMEQELGLVAGRPVKILFTPAYAPITRGILNIIHAFPARPVSRQQLLDLYLEFYRDEPFIHINTASKEEGSWVNAPYPWVAATSGTNHCHIGLDVDEDRGGIVLFSALDSVGKGGAHAAVQNMNLMFGFPETLGLNRWGLHPY